MRTRETIEASQSDTTVKSSEKKYARGQHPNSKKNIKPWQPGQSGNPGGKPKTDMAQVIARAVFENNPVVLYQAYSKALAKGQAFAFQVLSDRAYGKLKETHEHIEGEVADSNLEERVAQLERELYPAVFPTVTREAGEAARVGSTQGGTEKADGAAKDSDVLPR